MCLGIFVANVILSRELKSVDFLSCFPSTIGGDNSFCSFIEVCPHPQRHIRRCTLGFLSCFPSTKILRVTSYVKHSRLWLHKFYRELLSYAQSMFYRIIILPNKELNLIPSILVFVSCFSFNYKFERTRIITSLCWLSVQLL